jgi:hypothetical protein
VQGALFDPLTEYKVAGAKGQVTADVIADRARSGS